MLKFTGRIACRAAAAVVLLGLAILFDGAAVASSGAERPYSEFLMAVDAGKVSEVVIDGEDVTWKDQSGNQFETIRLDDPDLVRTLRDRGVIIRVVAEQSDNPVLYALVNWFPMLALICVWIYFMRRYRAGRAGQQSVAADLQDLAAKLDGTNAHLARIEALLAGSPPKGRSPDLGT